MMGARADQTMAHLLWSRLFGQRFTNHALQRGLPSHHANGHRLTVKYFCKIAPRGRCWRRRRRRWYHAGRHVPFGRGVLWYAPILVELAAAARSGWRKGSVLAGRWRAAHLTQSSLPGRSFGAEHVGGHHNLALLSVINLSPDQYRLLRLLGLPEEDVFEALSCRLPVPRPATLQLTGSDSQNRSRVRCPMLARSAAGLERMLKGCEVRQMPEHLVPQVAEPSRRGPKPSGMAMEPAERQRKSRAARRAQMEQEKQRQREAAD